MPTYRDLSDNPLSPEDALSKVRFVLSWSEGPEVDCFLADDDRWSVKRTDRAINDVSGWIRRVDGFFYWEGHSERFERFDEAVKKLLQPI